MNRLDELIKKSGMTVQRVAELAGLTRDAVNRIKAGTVNLNEERMRKFSTVLNCYPSELLQLEWQKPGELNEQALIKAINIAMTIFKHTPLNPEQLSHIIITEYKDIINQGLSTRDDNSNIG